MTKCSRLASGKPAKFSKLLMFFGALLIVAQVFLANSLSVQGKEISRLENFKGDVGREISSLKEQSAALSSLSSIKALAKEKLSMVDGLGSFDYLGSSVALR